MDMDVIERLESGHPRKSQRGTGSKVPLTKFERIRLVRALGLNTEDDILITSERDWQCRQDWLSRHDRFTVRTFRETIERTGIEPYFAVIGRDEFEPHRKKFLAEGWKLIIAEPVDPVDALLAGTILRDGDATEIDIVRGSGSVTRQVTHDGRIDAHVVVRIGELTGDPLLDEALDEIRKTERRWPQLDVLRNVIYEFSYYNVEVGYKREHAIFWEITGYDRMDPGLDRALLKGVT